MNTFLKNDKILIIGGTGFIGRHLTRECLKQTPNVICLGFEEPKSMVAKMDYEFLNVDITKKESLKDALTHREFDYVINLGGYINHIQYFKGGRDVIDAHFTGLMNILDALKKDNLKGFVQIGSSDEYGSLPAPQKEDMREKPISPYSFAKVAASHFIKMLSETENFPGTVLRFFLVYGPEQDEKRFFPQIIKACLRNEEFKTSEGKQLRDFCYIEDVTKAIIAAAKTDESRGKIINIGSGKPVYIRDMVEKVTKITGGGKPLWGAHPYRKGENMALYPDVSAAKNILKWQSKITLDEGLTRTVKYYKNIFSEVKK